MIFLEQNHLLTVRQHQSVLKSVSYNYNDLGLLGF